MKFELGDEVIIKRVPHPCYYKEFLGKIGTIVYIVYEGRVYTVKINRGKLINLKKSSIISRNKVSEILFGVNT